MANKFYNEQNFKATVNGHEYVFCCASQSTSYGFRHVCVRYRDCGSVNFRAFRASDISRCSYYNRTWERFKYETVLRKEIERQDLPKEVIDELVAILIDGKAQKEHEECEKQIAAFQALYNNTSDTFKEKAKNIHITSEEQAQEVMSLMKLDVALQALGMVD